jgi:hypothetical protein
MLIAEAAEASVEINPLGASAAPTISGNVYVSEGCKDLVLTIRFWLPAASSAVTRLTEIVATDAL